jgi:hypothetical protein
MQIANWNGVNRKGNSPRKGAEDAKGKDISDEEDGRIKREIASGAGWDLWAEWE